MAIDPRELNYQKVLNLFLEKSLLETDSQINQDLYDGNHWGGGQYWKGPQLEGNDEISRTVKKGVERDHTSKNVTRGIIKRRRRGVLGKEPGWTITVKRTPRKVPKMIPDPAFTPDPNDPTKAAPLIPSPDGEMVFEDPTRDEQERIDELNNLLLKWWNHARALLVFRKAFTNLDIGARGPLKIYIPPARMKKTPDGRNMLPKLKPDEAVKAVYLLAPKREECLVYTDPESMRKFGVHRYQLPGGRERIDVSYVDETDGQTVFRVFDQEGVLESVVEGVKRLASRLFGSTDRPNEWKYPMNGQLFITEMEGESIITQQMRDNQLGIVAKGMTMLSTNLDYAGFREHVYTNMRPPGKKLLVDDPDHPGKKIEVFTLGSIPVGAGSRIFGEGTSYTETGPDGKKSTRLANPGVHVIDPVPVDTFEKTVGLGTHNILEEADQLHVEIAADADSSGESRKQARDDYYKSLVELKPIIDYAGSEVLEAVAGLLAVLMGSPGRFDDLMVQFDAKVDPGPLSAQDRELLIKERNAKARSREDHMQQIGVDDPDGMKAKIRQEEEEDGPSESAEEEDDDTQGGKGE